MQNLKIGLLAASEYVLKHYSRELRRHSDVSWAVTLPETLKVLRARGEQNIFFSSEITALYSPKLVHRIFESARYRLFGDPRAKVARKLVRRMDVDIWVTDSNGRLDKTEKRVPYVQTFHAISMKEGCFFNCQPMIYDLLLFPGEYHKNIFMKHFSLKSDKKLRVIGWPKVDDFFVPGKMQTKEEILTSLSLNPDKPTILYAPTWGSYGKHGLFARWFDREIEVFENLCLYCAKQEINFIVKMHGFIDNSNLESAQKIALNHGAVWSEDSNSDYTIDPNNFLWATDVLIGDLSGINQEFMVLDRPIIYIDHDDSINPWETAELPSSFRAGHVIREESELIKAIEDSLVNPQRFSNRRYEIVEKLFYKLDGNAALRGAQAIMELIDRNPSSNI